MFEQSFVQATATTHRGAPVALSLLLQVSVIGTGVLIPLLNPDLLPTAMMGNTLFLAPPSPAPAPPPSTPVTGTITRALRQLRDGVLIMPASIPSKVAHIEEPPDGATVGVGVAGSIFTGQGGGGVVDSLVRSMTRTEAPPVPVVVVKEPERAKPIVRTRVGGNVQDALVISRKIPEYPAIARSMRVEGKVVFQAVIGTAGTIQQLQLVSGHPLLVQAAMDAVRLWRYRPTMLNGDPIEVDTIISVNFTLNR
ncbi:MAG: energy transducer TonB [Bryobacterales bacterium]|nr:energy transducer TonB [Bryobacterales bacterium]